MKKPLKNLLKSRNPMKNKISDVIEKKLSLKPELQVVPQSNEIPVQDIEPSTKLDKTTIAQPDKTDYLKKEKESSPKYVEGLRDAIKNILNQSNVTNNYNSQTTNVNNKNIQRDTKYSTTNEIKNAIKNISSVMNKDVIKNITESSSNHVKNAETNIFNKANKRSNRNYITSSVYLPFIEESQSIQNTYPTVNNSQSVQNKNFTADKNQKPALIEKTNNFYKTSSNIKVAKPSIAKFPEVVDSRTTKFNTENSYLTKKINNILESSPTVRIFTTKGDVIKSTKEVLNHIKTRQNNIVPMLQEGGVLDSPTLAMLGEAGPEMVQPMSGSSDLSSMVPPANLSNSITSLANDTLQERAAYQAQSAGTQMKPYQQKETSVDTSGFSVPRTTKTTPPVPEGNGGGGTDGFGSYLRSRMFSLPDWRSRLG